MAVEDVLDQSTVTPLWARPLQISSGLVDEGLQMAFRLPSLGLSASPMCKSLPSVHMIACKKRALLFADAVARNDLDSGRMQNIASLLDCQAVLLQTVNHSAFSPHSNTRDLFMVQGDRILSSLPYRLYVLQTVARKKGIYQLLKG